MGTVLILFVLGVPWMLIVAALIGAFMFREVLADSVRQNEERYDHDS